MKETELTSRLDRLRSMFGDSSTGAESSTAEDPSGTAGTLDAPSQRKNRSEVITQAEQPAAPAEPIALSRHAVTAPAPAPVRGTPGGFDILEPPAVKGHFDLQAKVMKDPRLERYAPQGLVAAMCDGFVLRGLNPDSGRAVAIKVKQWPMNHPLVTDMFKMIQQREMAFNDLMMEEDPQDEKHICRCIESWEAQTCDEKLKQQGHSVIVFEMLGATLGGVIEHMQGTVLQRPNSLPLRHLRRYARDMLEALAFLQLHEVIHGDLKPENVCHDPLDLGSLKLIDLDSAIMVGEDSDGCLQSQHYRAPEVFCEMAPFTTKVDVFSVGIMLCELYRGQIMFMDCDEKAQLHKMDRLLGPWPASMAQHEVVSSLPPVERDEDALYDFLVSMDDEDEELSQYFRSMVTGLLQLDPLARTSPQDALKHEFFTTAL